MTVVHRACEGIGHFPGARCEHRLGAHRAAIRLNLELDDRHVVRLQIVEPAALRERHILTQRQLLLGTPGAGISQQLTRFLRPVFAQFHGGGVRTDVDVAEIDLQIQPAAHRNRQLEDLACLPQPAGIQQDSALDGMGLGQILLADRRIGRKNGDRLLSGMERRGRVNEHGGTRKAEMGRALGHRTGGRLTNAFELDRGGGMIQPGFERFGEKHPAVVALARYGGAIKPAFGKRGAHRRLRLVDPAKPAQCLALSQANQRQAGLVGLGLAQEIGFERREIDERTRGVACVELGRRGIEALLDRGFGGGWSGGRGGLSESRRAHRRHR